MPNLEETASADERAIAAFDRQLEAESTSAVTEPVPEPEPDSEPEPVPAVEKEPKIAASTGEVDKRTKQGRKQSIQAEIDAETARKYTAKQEADAEEARLTNLRAERARLTQEPRTAPQATPASVEPPVAAWKRIMALPEAPKPEQFTGENAWNEYQYAVNYFVADRVRQEERHAQQIATQNKPFEDRIAAELANDATFSQKLQSTPIDTRIIPYLHGHPRGTDVMVYLVNHPQVAQQLTLLNPIDQIGQIGEIVGALKARQTAAPSGPASKASPISQAKPLIKPVSAAPNASDDDEEPDEAELSTEEFIRRRNKAEHIPIPIRRR